MKKHGFLKSCLNISFWIISEQEQVNENTFVGTYIVQNLTESTEIVSR